jgi:hypothetical protein
LGLPVVRGFIAVHCVPHGGSAAMLHLHETPVFMRVQRIPSFVTMRPVGTQSQWQMADFHSFLRFLSYFGPFFPVFTESERFYTKISRPKRLAEGTPANLDSSPKSTLF